MSMTCPKCGGSGEIITGDEARQLRQKRGLTLSQVSTKMKISLPYLADLEHGRRQWNTELLTTFKRAISK
jgi:transcriptional regulator with XRE-family HTH domain